MMFKSLKLPFTVMVECNALPNVTHVLKITCSYFPRQKNSTRQMQILIPHEVIQVVSH